MLRGVEWFPFLCHLRTLYIALSIRIVHTLDPHKIDFPETIARKFDTDDNGRDIYPMYQIWCKFVVTLGECVKYNQISICIDKSIAHKLTVLPLR